MQLQRPLVVFDIEATGLKKSYDRICSIGMVKRYTDGHELREYHLVNPGRTPSNEILQLTGLDPDALAAAPAFERLAVALHDFLSDCDLCGYNLLGFDIPMLAEEFHRCGISWPSADVRIIDAQSIFHQREPRTLSGAVRFYLDESHEGAHDAMADALATLRVFDAQVRRYGLPTNVDHLHAYCLRGKGLADAARLTYYDEEKVLRWNFGTYRDEPVADNLSYIDWMATRDFPGATIEFLNRWRAEYLRHANFPF